MSMQDNVFNLASGAAQANLNMEKFKTLKIPIPTLQTQHQIVQELETIETSIQTLRTRVDQLKREKELFHKYGRKGKLMGLWEGCEWRALGEVCEMQAGNTPTKTVSKTGEYPFYRASAKNPYSTHHTPCFLGDEYILFVKSGGNSTNPTSSTHGIGKAFLVAGNSAGTTDVVKIQPSPITNVQFFHHVLTFFRTDFQMMAHYTTGLGHISMTKMKAFKIPIPTPAIQTQSIAIFEAKAKHIQTLNESIQREEQHIKDLQQLGKDVIASFCCTKE